jgi:hypothetical protein
LSRNRQGVGFRAVRRRGFVQNCKDAVKEPATVVWKTSVRQIEPLR